MAFADLRHLARDLPDALQLARRGTDPHDGGDREPERRRVELRVVAADRTGAFEALDPVCDRRGREADPAPELGECEAAVCLELGEDAEVQSVE